MKEEGIICGNMFNPSPKMGTNGLFVTTHLDQKEPMEVGHLPTHVPSIMFNNANGEKENMSTM
jgi:hypothetical protein